MGSKTPEATEAQVVSLTFSFKGTPPPRAVLLRQEAYNSTVHALGLRSKPLAHSYLSAAL